MNALKKTLAPILGDYVDEGKYTYRLLRQKMETTGLDFVVNGLKRTKDGEIYFHEGSMGKRPIFMDFLKRAMVLVTPNEINSKTLKFRRESYRPYLLLDEKYQITVKTKTQEVVIEGTGNSLTSLQVQKDNGGTLNHNPQFLEEVLEAKGMIINLKILEPSPLRKHLEEIFKTKAYVQKLLDPEKLWDSIHLMDVKLERLRLHGVEIKAKDANFEKVLKEKTSHWRWSNFGVRDVLDLENIVQCFPEGISNEKLLSKWPHEEAGVYLRWHQLIQKLVKSGDPYPIV